MRRTPREIASALLPFRPGRERGAALPEGMTFEPLMTLYLTDTLAPEEIVRAKAAGVVALKLYPAGATTNSDAGVTDIRKIYPTLEAMQREGLVLLVLYLLGILGALLARFIGGALGWYSPGEPTGFIASVIGAILLLVIYGFVRKKK